MFNTVTDRCQSNAAGCRIGELVVLRQGGIVGVHSHLEVTPSAADGVTALAVTGVLDTTTYMKLRDLVIKAAVDEPTAVVVDVSALRVPADSAWMVFINAHWQVNMWHEVPMALVCSHRQGREAIRRNGLTRYLQVYSSLPEAVGGVPRSSPLRRRAHVELPIMPDVVARARCLVTNWLTRWSKTEFIDAATTVATVFIEDVINQSTSRSATLRVETNGTCVTVALDDANPKPAKLRDTCPDLPGASGVEILRILSREWGNTPSNSGKTVWAVIGPADRH